MKRKKYCFVTWYHPSLKRREDLKTLDNLFVLCQDNYQSLPGFKAKMFLTMMDDKSVGMNTLMNYLIDKCLWAIVFHPKVQVEIDKVFFPDYSRVYYSDGSDWQNTFKEFSSLHFALVARTYDFLPWDSSRNNSESQNLYVNSIKGSNLTKQIKPFWKLL